ncbi:MAG TPA: FHA domain-containing protein [Bryobacteraceae bacterium]|nr:FHA domain-containing protein [Bryobacteraceae bacterium]
MRQQEAAQVTPEDIIHLILEEMQAGMCPSFYSNLVPSVYQVFLYGEDLDRLRPLEQRMRDEAVRALEEKLAELNKSAEPSKLKLPLGGAKHRKKKYEALGDFTVEFHENTDDDARENPLIIHSTFPSEASSDDRVGTLTERVTRRSADGQTITTATQRSGTLDARASAGIVHASIEWEDDTGAHSYQMTKDLIKIGRGAADRWVDVKLKAKKDVSREHLQIRRDATTGEFFIKDLSTLGTTVNGKRVPGSIEQVNGADVDKNLEVPLPGKASIGLAGVLSLEFKAAKA